jgi:hypothetical protein
MDERSQVFLPGARSRVPGTSEKKKPWISQGFDNRDQSFVGLLGR